jgi:hypothetical protein
MLAYRICNFSWELFILYTIANEFTTRTVNCNTLMPGKSSYLLMARNSENMFCLNFIPANVKNNNTYLKTNVLKNC